MSEVAPVAAPAAAPAVTTNASVDKGTSSDPKTAATGTSSDPKPAATDSKPERYLIKVNGKLKELTRDDLIRKAQMADASQEKWAKSAERTKRVQTLLGALQDPDPDRQEAALRELGMDPDKLAERRLTRRVQDAQLTPEQRRIAELEAQIQNEARSAKERDAQREQEQREALDKAEWGRLEAEYTAEIDRASKAGELAGLKPAEVLYHMADAAEMNLEFGMQLTPTQLLQEAKGKITDMRESLRSQVLGSLQGDQLLDFMGVDVVNRVLAAARDRYKRGQAQPPQKPAQIAPSAPEKPQFVRPSDIKPPWL